MTLEDNPSYQPDHADYSTTNLEHSYLKVPFEQTRRLFRNQLRIIEREIAALLPSSLDRTQADKRKKLIEKVTTILHKVSEFSLA